MAEIQVNSTAPRDRNPGIMPWAVYILYLAGLPDEKSAEDFWAPLQGKEGGVLQVMSREDGEKHARLRLDSPPVYNGMAAAGDALYISLENGSLVCFDAPNQVADSHR